MKLLQYHYSNTEFSRFLFILECQRKCKVFNITQFIDKFELCMSPFPTDDITQILLNSSPPSPPSRLCARLLWMQGLSIHTPSRFSSEQYLGTYFGGDILY